VTCGLRIYARRIAGSQLITFDRSHLGALNQILMNEQSYIPKQLVYQYACHIFSPPACLTKWDKIQIEQGYLELIKFLYIAGLVGSIRPPYTKPRSAPSLRMFFQKASSAALDNKLFLSISSKLTDPSN
jgi:hypothetical protein